MRKRVGAMRVARALVSFAIISVLIASPVLSDKVVLLSGQSYEGEIIEETDTYIHLKTDSETLRILRTEIDSIQAEEFPETITLRTQTPSGARMLKGEIVEVTIEQVKLRTVVKQETRVLQFFLSDIEEIEGADDRLVMLLDAANRGTLTAEKDVSKLQWFGTGCLLSALGVGIAWATVLGSPAESYLLGRSPDYAEAFTIAYERKCKETQTEWALIGCLLSATYLACVISFIHSMDWDWGPR
jgi:hypothetical protein